MSFFEYLGTRWTHLLELTIQHAEVVLFAVSVSTVIGVTLGVLTYRRDRLQALVLARDLPLS